MCPNSILLVCRTCQETGNVPFVGLSHALSNQKQKQLLGLLRIKDTALAGTHLRQGRSHYSYMEAYWLGLPSSSLGTSCNSFSHVSRGASYAMLPTHKCAANSQLQHKAQAVDAVSALHKTCVHIPVLCMWILDLTSDGASPPLTLEYIPRSKGSRLAVTARCRFDCVVATDVILPQTQYLCALQMTPLKQVRLKFDHSLPASRYTSIHLLFYNLNYACS